MEPQNYIVPFNELFKLMIDADQPLSKSPNRLIGYRDYVDIFCGLIPFADYDENGNFSYSSDFPEIFPGAVSRTTASAVLFTGDTGCGKHTADLTFMSVVYRYMKKRAAAGDFDTAKGKTKLEDILAFYRLDLSEYDAQPERKIAQALEELTNRLYDEAVSVPAKLFYFSLGDLTRILESKNLSRLLAAKVRRLIGDTRSRCILTGIYDGRSSALEDHCKKPFFVLELEPPSEASRREYFEQLTKNYPGVRWESDVVELVMLTEGFTFAMIKEMAAYLLMTVKNEALRKKIGIDRVRFETLSEEESITVPQTKVRFFAQLIKQSRYVRPAPAAPAVITAPAAEPAPQEKSAPSETPASPVKPAKPVSSDEELPPEMPQPDREKDIEEALEGMMVPKGQRFTVVLSGRVFSASAMQQAHLTVREFLLACRSEGYVSLNNLESAKLGLIDNLKLYPVNKELLSDKPLTEEECDYTPVILEGKIDSGALARAGLDEQKLQQLLDAQNTRQEEAFLAVCTRDNELVVYRAQ